MKVLKSLMFVGVLSFAASAQAVYFDADGRSYDDDYTGEIFSAEYEEWIIPAEMSRARQGNSEAVFFDANGVAYPASYTGEIFSAEYEEWIVPAELSSSRTKNSCVIVGLEVANDDGQIWSVEYEEWMSVAEICSIQN